VAEITDGGQREMFSTEFWLYPDVPFGSTLWINTPRKMENYIAACNEQQEANDDYDGHCTVPFLLPIHLAPLFSIFLPQVVTKIYRTMQF
jgi:hypothetical protein